MRRKALAASQTAQRWFLYTLALTTALVVIGVAGALRLSNTILAPVRELTAAITRVAAGDLDAVVHVKSGDEIGRLADGFNRMAERIRELRRSDLGKLLVAQQTTEAAIDSLYDPVIVTDSDGLVTRTNPAAERLFGPRGVDDRKADRCKWRAISESHRPSPMCYGRSGLWHPRAPGLSCLGPSMEPNAHSGCGRRRCATPTIAWWAP